MTVLRNDAAPGELSFRLSDWSLLSEGRAQPPPSVAAWMSQWRALGLTETAQIAFRWAQFPPEQEYAVGEWNQGMLATGLPPGSHFDLIARWTVAGKSYEGKLELPNTAAHDHHPGGYRALGGPARQARQVPRSQQTFLKNYRGRLLTTWAVLTEFSHLAPSAEAILPLYRWIDNGGLEVFPLGRDELVCAVDWIERYADQPMDLADASLVVAALTTGFSQVWTLDRRDFETYRLLSRKRFKLVA